ncbi:hypothetical protein AB1K70_05585 [Bremerella sp. JC770]|uniref:hypothetical protein n=1 Tax=Bremerella sp. JC770 TaxID=3232137 RepID=UPI003458E9DE
MRLLTVLVFLLAILSGCQPSSDVQRYNVRGSVTYEGKPVPTGTIMMTPANGNKGPGGYAEIRDGRFDTATTGQGPTGGPHHVVIQGYDGKSNPANELPMGKALFDPYETDVNLPTSDTTNDFDIPASAIRQPSTGGSRGKA